MFDSTWPATLPAPLSLRPVHDKDSDFIFETFFQTRREEFLPLGWPETALRDLLASQWRLQSADWSARYPDSRHFVISLTAPENAVGTAVDAGLSETTVDAGRLWIDESPSTLHLIDIAILPAFQNRGFGTSIMRALHGHATERGLPLTFTVFKGNEGAMRLYRRLGSETTGETAGESHWTMQLTPDTPATKPGATG